MLTVGALLVGMTGRVAYLQTYGREKTIRSADRQHLQVESLPSRRGTIFDCNGSLMAGTVQKKALFIDPKFMADFFGAEGSDGKEYYRALEKLARILDVDYAQLCNDLADQYKSRYVKIKEGLEDDEVERVTKLNLPGVGFTTVNVRTYPMGSVAAHVLGDTNSEGHGLEGLELYFDKELAGHDGWKRTLKDARRHEIAVAADDYHPAEHGHHLILTIDANLQLMTEQELERTCKENKADRGECIVMDPRNGDVLAMANWPTFNPQLLEDSTPALRRNRCLTDPYEPGSTIKPFLAGPALSWRLARLDEEFTLHGPKHTVIYTDARGREHHRTITDVHGYDKLPLWDVLVKSSNIGMCLLGRRIGNEKLHKALTTFCFGQKTGIELPAEHPGRINPLKQWTQYSTESVSQGYEILVTPLQLCRAFCAYANGGRLVTPRLVKGVLDGEGNVIQRSDMRLAGAGGADDLAQQTAEFIMPSAIDPHTAAEVRRVLCDVVIRGTATKARSKVWNLFGKTGTAHVSVHGSYSDAKFTSSFIGGAPAERPRLVVAMIIHEPDKAIAHYGGAVAAPGAQRLLDRALEYLQVPGSPELPLPPPNVLEKLDHFNINAYRARSASAHD